MDTLLHDIRYGLKLLLKDRGFSSTVVLTLALAIGANVAMWAVVRSVLFEPLAVPEADRLVLVTKSYPNAGVDRVGASVPDFFERRAQIEAFEDVALYNRRSLAVGLEGVGVERLRVMEATPSLLPLLRAEPSLGRVFTEEEGEPGNDRSVILTHDLWQSLFAGAGDVLERDLRVDGRPHRIVGVLPQGFTFLDPEVRLWLPEAFDEEQKAAGRRHSHNHEMVARLAPDASLEQANQQIAALDARNLESSPEMREVLTNAGFRTQVVGLHNDLVQDVRSTLYFLWAGVAFVLLIAIVNLTNLTLVRSTARVKELTTRFALGAGRRRVLRQLMTESLVLTGLGGILGLVVGRGALRALQTLGMGGIPRSYEVQLDASAVLVTLVLALGIGLVLGSIPAFGVFRADIATVLRQEGRTGTGGRRVQALRRGLVVAQVAFAFMLVAGAGLLLASFRAVLAVDPGFEPEGVLTATVRLPEARYPEDKDLLGYTDRALERLAALPAVDAAGATNIIPFGGDYSDGVILAEGVEIAPGEALVAPSQTVVSPGYFDAMGIELLAGRTFDGRDTQDAVAVAVVDRELARHFWGDRDPLGRRMFFPSNGTNFSEPSDDAEFITVVGVVENMVQRNLEGSSEPVGGFYFPHTQAPRRTATFALRTRGNPEALGQDLRRVLGDLDPEAPVFGMFSMEQRLDNSLSRRRFSMVLSVAFGGVALALAAIGLYGVLAFLVTQRRRELGLRMALGSTAGRIFGLVLREGGAIVGLGLLLGLLGAAALRRGLDSLLYGVGSFDPAVLTAVLTLLAGVGLVACVLPGLRAVRIDPAKVLHEE